MRTKETKIIAGSFVIIVLLIIGTGWFLLNKLNKENEILRQEFESKAEQLQNDVEQSEKRITEAVRQEHDFNIEQRNIIKQESDQNFQTLQEFFDSENQKLKLNLEGQIGQVSDKVGGLEELSLELEDKISDINVQSTDFSSIIDDVIRTVVSVQTPSGQGSGVFVTDDGYLVTNGHVVAGESQISVVDYDGNQYNVESVAISNEIDLAVLKLASNQTFDYLKFSNGVDIGDRVIAVGNPLGLSFSVSEGIISATDRVIDESGVGYVQTDVSINPGNSGGPLVDTNKRIVGINTLKIFETEGLGFALPADKVEELVNQIIP